MNQFNNHGKHEHETIREDRNTQSKPAKKSQVKSTLKPNRPQDRNR
ncbi:MAG: hypothetical protein Q8R83_03235 [Legionellaceae bacterium]|nr:hypothetical protein [Legionellaceae bacterium]